MTGGKYVVCGQDCIPETVRFDVPGRYQGQTVEVAYGGYSRGEHDSGDPYKRVRDRSDGRVTYYRWTTAEEPMTGIARLRAMTKLFARCGESFNVRFSVAQLESIYASYARDARDGLDVVPDQWTEARLADVLAKAPADRVHALLFADAGEAAERRIIELREELAEAERARVEAVRVNERLRARVEALCAEADEAGDARVDIDVLRGALAD